MQNSQQSLLADNEVNADDEESSRAPRYPMGRLMVLVGLVGAVCLIALVAAGPNLDSSQSSDSADAGGLWGRVSSWWHNRGKGNTAPPSCSECVAGSGGIACASKCLECGTTCTSCIRGGGGKACAAKCCAGPSPLPTPTSGGGAGPTPTSGGGAGAFGSCDDLAAEKLNEGYRTVVYKDSMGIRTIGIGFNLEQNNAKAKVEACGGNYGDAMAGKAMSAGVIACLFEQSIQDARECGPRLLGASSWAGLPSSAKSAVTDMAYNMGEAPTPFSSPLCCGLSDM